LRSHLKPLSKTILCYLGAVGGHIAAAAELRTSLTSIVDALRDFLTNIRVPERPNDADVDDDDGTEEDDLDYLT
jgi:hypothetical protein